MKAAARGVSGGGSSTSGSCMPVDRLMQAASSCLWVTSRIRLAGREREREEIEREKRFRKMRLVTASMTNGRRELVNTHKEKCTLPFFHNTTGFKRQHKKAGHPINTPTNSIPSPPMTHLKKLTSFPDPDCCPVVDGVLLVVDHGIVPDQSEVSLKLPHAVVLVGLHLVTHGAEVHWVLDDV